MRCNVRAGCCCKRRQPHAFGGFIKPLALGFKGWIGGGILRVRMVVGGMGGGMGGWVGFRVGFININDMYNNDVCQGVVYTYGPYEAK